MIVYDKEGKIVMLQDVVSAVTDTGEPVLSFHFIVILGKLIIPFQSISGIGMKRDFQYINEGGRNDYPIRLMNPQSSPHELTFKRGIPTGGFRDPFLSDYFCPMDKETVFLMQRCKSIRGAAGRIVVLNRNHVPKASYSFVAQGLSEWSVSELDSMSGTQPLIETMTVIHNGLKRDSVARLKLIGTLSSIF